MVSSTRDERSPRIAFLSAGLDRIGMSKPLALLLEKRFMKVAAAGWPVNRGYTGVTQAFYRGFTRSPTLFNPWIAPVYSLLHSQAAGSVRFRSGPAAITQSHG
jgi:hypothetical protein